LEAQRGRTISIRTARKYFPTANRLQLRDPERGLNYVVDAHGETLGLLLTTSPHTDNIIGYSGPSDVLIALDKNGAITGLELLRSGDTHEHVEKVASDKNFFRRFVGWKPNESPPLKIEGVAGATLTSYAIAEAIQQRLVGAAPSLRFPEPVTLNEVRALFTNATQIASDGQKFRVSDARKQLLGYALRTSPQADNVGGYRGPTEALVALAPDARTVTGVRIRSSYDTASYVDSVRNDDYYLKLFQGRTLEQLAAMDFKKEKIEGVSGATQTSFAVAEGLKRRAAAELKLRDRVTAWKPRPRDWGLAGVVAGACVLAFTPLRGKRLVRIGWQLLLIVYVGIINSDLLSLSLFNGWMTSSVALRAAPGLVFLATAALLVPLFSRRQLYCHHICPHGAAQELLGSWRRRAAPRSGNSGECRRVFGKSAALFRNAATVLSLLPFALLAFALIVASIGWRFDLANIEPFDAWSWRAAGWATITIAAVGLVGSIFIPQAYCRFGCPTGALLGFIRSTGSGDRFGRRDWAALLLIGFALATAGITRALPKHEPAPEIRTFTGRTMGTTWTVKIRDEVADPVAISSAISNKFEWCEQMTSHWRTNTELSQFNRSEETNAVFVPWPVLTLVRWSQEISRATDGAFDITVGPLVQLWGFGPPPRRTNAPSDAEIAALLPAAGWQKLHVVEGALQKDHPALGIDLSAIAPGWANDQIAELLPLRGYTNFLVESGGELRASGAWPIAIEHPTRSVILTNRSIGTSGTYRQNHKIGSVEYSHLIDPHTGRPVTHSTISVSVIHTNCAQADAWGAALNVMGIEKGLALAERLGLAAQFVVQKENGSLEVRSSSRWPQTDQHR
jgi:thiamine biosynthesis lipoprotein ApbE/Na+-translocating ferredoxin:NAD+ oxidoreductase RnfG subunit